jgi:peptidoglycan hydrolase-like protein with peptidoglycan-binding domain
MTARDLLTVQGAVQVQARLRILRFFAGELDGFWGPKSRRALHDFKVINGMARDDLYDIATEALLFSRDARPANRILNIPILPHGEWAPARYEPPAGCYLNPLNMDDAARIQARLAALGFYSAAGDGVWGSDSHVSLRAFKASRGLSPDDMWDAATETALGVSGLSSRALDPAPRSIFASSDH